jgi:hypothetical protein
MQFHQWGGKEAALKQKAESGLGDVKAKVEGVVGEVKGKVKEVTSK